MFKSTLNFVTFCCTIFLIMFTIFLSTFSRHATYKGIGTFRVKSLEQRAISDNVVVVGFDPVIL